MLHVTQRMWSYSQNAYFGGKINEKFVKSSVFEKHTQRQRATYVIRFLVMIEDI